MTTTAPPRPPGPGLATGRASRAATTAGPAILAEGLEKRFGDTRALAGVDLSAEAGTILGVLGPNGAGKTTAVRILATLARPDGGRATVGGHDVVRDAAAVRRTIGLTGQFASVDETLTGRENLVLIGRLLDLSRRDARARAAELLDWFELTEAADRPSRTYSGGMRRRLDLAASLVGRPAVVFLDEPTTGLDPQKREAMWGVVRSLVREGSTVLLTTQYLEEDDALAGRITVIDRGRVIANDTPRGLKRAVGGQTLTVTPTDPHDAPEAARLVAAATGSPDVRVGDDGATVVAAVSGDGGLAPATAALAEHRIGVTELALRLPSLDEVFATLTAPGRTTAPPTPGGDGPAATRAGVPA